jgi:multiple sugar transport system permease protein
VTSLTRPRPLARTGPRAASRTSIEPGQRKGLVPTVMVLMLFLYFMLPLHWLVVSSTKSQAELFATFGLWFGSEFNLVQNLRDLFAYGNGIFGRWLLNTAFYAVTSAVGASLLAALGGYAFAKYRFKGRELLFAIILGAIMVPLTALVIPTFLLMSRIGLINTPWAVILPSLVNPFGLYLMRVYAQTSIPQDLLEAGRVDGAGEFRIFRSVAFPMMLPGFVTVLLFAFVATWNNFFLPLVVLSSQELLPVTVGLSQMNSTAFAGGGAQVMFSVVITGSLVAVLPLIIGFVFLQRYWRGGLSLGAVK